MLIISFKHQNGKPDMLVFRERYRYIDEAPVMTVETPYGDEMDPIWMPLIVTKIHTDGSVFQGFPLKVEFVSKFVHEPK